MKNLLVLFTIILFLSFSAKGQGVFDKKISVEYKNMSIEDILFDLQQKIGINFSYASKIFSSEKKISVKGENEYVKDVLQKIFLNAHISFEQKGRQIILKKNNSPVVVQNENKILQKPSFTLEKIEIYQPDTVTNSQSVIIPLKEKPIRDSLSELQKKDQKKISDKYSPATDSLYKKNIGINNEQKKQKEFLSTTYSIPITKKKQRFQHFVLINYVKTNYNGIQTAGLLNVAKKVKGSQFGLVNIANSVSGVQIGLLSICKSGYKKIELWSSRTLHANVAFKTGTKKLYNIFAVSFNPRDHFEDFNWGVGYGCGSEQTTGKKTILNIEVIAYKFGNHMGEGSKKLNLLNQLRINFGYKLTQSVSVFIGPEFNIKFYTHQESQHNVLPNHNQDADDTIVNSASLNPVSKTSSHASVRTTFGINGGIRF